MWYNQEETGMRLILHVSYGCSNVAVVIDLYHFYDLNVNKLRREYDVGQCK